MRVDAEILRCQFVSSVLRFLILHGIGLWMAVAEVKGLLRFRRSQFLRIGKGVPPPVGHGTEGNTVPVVVGVTLQSCHIDRSGEMSVADRQGCKRVNFLDDGAVTKKNSLAIDRGC